MIIEYTYNMPGGINLKTLMDFMDWWEGNFPKEYLTIKQGNEAEKSICSIDGQRILYIQYPLKTVITLKFKNMNDINYFRLLYDKEFDQYLISETVEY